MGVNGIYGLSGSGLDIESMVKVGMLGKKAEYDKMQQKYTKDEWKKAEFLSLYGEIQTFNASTITKYKMSSNMNSRSAESANSSALTATANANAATMTHYVEVETMASSAYLIGTKSPERQNNAADQKTQLSSVLFSSIEAKNDDDTKVILNGTKEVGLNDVAFSFSINDGVNGLMTSDNSDVVVASASPDAATGDYKVAITSMATPASINSSLSSFEFPNDVQTLTTNSTILEAFSDVAYSQLKNQGVSKEQAASLIQYYLRANANTNNANTAVAFTISDGTDEVDISYSYTDLFTLASNSQNFTDFVNTFNSKITSQNPNFGIKATISDNDTISFVNEKTGLDSKIVISMKETDGNRAKANAAINSIATLNIENTDSNETKLAKINTAFSATDSKFDSMATGIFCKVLGITGANGDFSVTAEGTDAVGTIVKLNNDGTEADTPKKLNFDGKVATTDDGITVTAKTTTTGMIMTNTGDQNISVTYKELLDGFTFYDLTSKVNSKGFNVRMNYDSVQDRFSLYNKKSGEENQINITFGTDDADEYAAANAVDFFNKLGLKLSSNGEIDKDNNITFAQGKTVSQNGVNSIAKVDGVEYKLDSNTVSVDGVTYNFKNITENSGKVAVTVSQDIDSIVKNVQSFVDDYNALLKKLYKWYDEKPNSDYKPLTETQKDAMKEEQIEKWEEKAKAGMLYHDKTLGKIITDIRSAVTSKVEGISGKYNNIFSLGISTTGLKGELTLDKDKLKTALSEDPDAVYNVFAKLDSNDEFNSNGVAQRLGDVFQKAMKNVKAVGGTSASIADDSELNNLMRELQTKMSNFKRMMQAFETKLYKKYDAMESSLALLGTQLNYVTSAFQ